MKKGERSEFQLKDWVEVFLEAEEILNSKINTENIKLNQLYAVENKLHSQLEEELVLVNKKSEKENISDNLRAPIWNENFKMCSIINIY